jgi:hypothetical protein
MVGDKEILFSLAGRIHVLLRRENNRIIDVEWMCADISYAKEVLRLATAANSDELHKLAGRVEQVYPLFPKVPKVEKMITSVQSEVERKYMNTLR